MDCDLWLERAKTNIETVPIDHVSVLKDLFEGVEWNTLDRGDKLHFGKHFKNAVVMKQIENVVYAGKAENNSAQYRKTEEEK